MNRDLPIIPTTAFIASIILAIAYFMYSVPLISHTPVTQLLTDQSNQSWVVYKNQIIPLESGKEPISMEPLGIDFHVGKVVALKDGGWLINSARHDVGLLSSIKKFLRLDEPENEGEAGSLLKCDHDLMRCKAWGAKRLHFVSPWRGLELANGRFIINDVTRHKVHLVSQNGERLDTLAGFRFPNHVEKVDDNYWIVDTNRFNLVELEITHENTLKRTELTENLAAYPEIQKKHQFPSLAYRDQQNWWTLIHDNNMSYAGIYRISPEGIEQFGSGIVDPTTFLKIDQALVVADYETRSILKVDIDTQQTAKLNIPILETLRLQDDKDVATETKNMWLIMAGIVTAGIAFLCFALFRSKPSKASNHPSLPIQMIDVSADTLLDEDQGEVQASKPRKLFWVGKNKKNLKKLKMTSILSSIVFGFVGVITALIPWLGYIGKKPELPFWLPLFSLLILITIPLAVRAINRQTKLIARSKLGVLGNKILYAAGKGQPIEINPEQMSYDSFGLISPHASLVWQTTKLTFFDKLEFESHVVPLLKAGNKQSTLQIYCKRFQAANNSQKFEWGLFATAFIAVIYVYEFLL